MYCQNYMYIGDQAYNKLAGLMLYHADAWRHDVKRPRSNDNQDL